MRKLETTKYTGGDITVYLTESQWKDMLNRFKIKNIYLLPRYMQKGSWFEIDVGCGLCKTFYNVREDVYCKGCPLTEAGCIHLLDRHGSEKLAMSSSNSQIRWHKYENEDVRRGIKKLRKVLLGMPQARRGKA